jgi:hypothetical protein
MLFSCPAIALAIVSFGIGQCLLTVVQSLQPGGRNIALTRFGYSDRNHSATASGGGFEDLSILAMSCPLALYAARALLFSVVFRPNVTDKLDERI